MIGESCVPRKQRNLRFGHLDHFQNIWNVLEIFEKWLKRTKNSNFFAFKAYTTLSHHFDPILVIFGLRLTLNHNKNVPNHNKHNQILWFMLILIWLTLILIWLTLILIWLRLILIWLALFLFGSRYSDVAQNMLYTYFKIQNSKKKKKILFIFFFF